VNHTQKEYTIQKEYYTQTRLCISTSYQHNHTSTTAKEEEMIKRSLMYDHKGREIEVTRNVERLDSVRLKELSRTERFTGKKNKSIAKF
jgi:hypothetical protein